MENFDDLDIQNYKLSITPILKATGIVITDLKGSEGLNKVVNYPGYGDHNTNIHQFQVVKKYQFQIYHLSL